MKKNVYMFIDALGWEIVFRNKFLLDELPFRYRVKMQFGYSSAAIPTILSGKSPSEHNHFSFYYYDKKNSPFKIFGYLKYFFGIGLHPKCLFNRGRVRRYLSKIFKWWKGYDGYFQLYGVPFDRLPYFDYCEKKDIFALGGLDKVKNLADIMREKEIRYHISDWRLSESENIRIAKDVIDRDEADFLFVYTADFDSFLHDNIFDEEKISERLKRYEDMAKSLLKSLEKYKDFSFTIISDHGMTARTGVIDLRGKLEDLGLKFGRDYISVFDSTMARFWFLNDDARKKIVSRFSENDCRGKFLSAEEKKSYGIDFSGDKYGEEIFLTDVGVQIEPCDLGMKSLKGMHGFSPEDKDSYAVYLSNKEPTFIPVEIKDFFKLMTLER